MAPPKPDTTTTISDKEEAARRIRLGEQAALMLNLDLITTDIESKRRFEDHIYKNFTCIQTGQVGHYDLTNKLSKRSAMKEFFKDIPTSVLAALVPSIKLYKVFYDLDPSQPSAQTGLPKVTNTYDWRIPFDDSTFSFQQDGNPFSPTSEFVRLARTNLGTFLDQRIPGAGIKSFSYDYKGTNPAETNTNISCDLELFFSTPETIIQKINIPETDVRYVSTKAPSGYHTFSYSDLVALSSRTNKSEYGQQLANLNYFRIKAVIGYSYIPASLRKILDNDSLTSKFNDEQKNNIIEAIETAKLVLMLTPVSFDLNFGEDGTVTMKIQYQAAVESIIGSQETDIFLISEEGKKFLEEKKKYERQLDDRDKKITAAKRENCDSPDKAKEAEKKILEDKYTKEELEKLSNNVEEARRNLYNSIYRKLVSIDPFVGSSRSPSMYSVEVKRVGIGLDDSGDPLKEADKVRQRYVNEAKGIRFLKKLNSQEKGDLSKELAKPPDGKTLGFIGSETTSAQESQTSLDKQTRADATKDTGGVFSGDNAGYNKIKFVLLGDLIDVGLECIRNISPENDIPRFVIGGMEIKIPTGGLIGSKLTVDTQKIFVNIADIPISFNLFQQFLLDKIVKPQRESYPLLLFIKDIISDLIIPSISPSIFGDDASANTSVRFSMLPLTVPMNLESKNIVDPLLGRKYNHVDFKYITNSDQLFVNNLKSVNGDPDIDFPHGTINYVFIYCSSQFTYEGNEEKDDKNNIFYFRLGTDRGIIKKISFSKNTSPYLREMLVRTEGRNDAYITQLYDANITMFGNNIFRPGDIIFVDPVYMFPYQKTNSRSGKEVDLQETLGLGGYYQVITVSTNISDMNYETNMKCTLVAVKNGKKTVTPDNKCK